MSGAIDVAQRALTEIPGWQNARLRPLTGGLTGHTWLAEKGTERAVLKADATVRSLPFRDRNAEAGIQQVAAQHGLAGAVLYSSPTVLLTEFVAGNIWQAADLATAENLHALGQTLAHVHALPPSGVRFDAPAAAKSYAARIGAQVDSTLVENHVDIVCRTVMREPLRLCHNDLVVENIVATPSLKLLDWEYAADNDPLFDIAVVVAHHKLNDARSLQLLSAWSGGDGREFVGPLHEQVKMYRSLCWLWEAARS